MLLKNDVHPQNDVLITVGAYLSLYYAFLGWLSNGNEVVIFEVSRWWLYVFESIELLGNPYLYWSLNYIAHKSSILLSHLAHKGFRIS